VHDGRYKYIRNHEPYKPYFQVLNYMEQEHTMREIRRLHARGELPPEVAQFAGPTKPLEELYDLRADPHEIHNLMGEVDRHPELGEALKRLRERHRQWVFGTRDTGLIPEPELAARESESRWRLDVLRGEEGRALLERLLRTNQLACDGSDALPDLLAALRDPDAAVRYWGAVGIGNLAPADAAARTVIESSLQDVSGSVRVAAARAMWRMGLTDKALRVLEEAVQSPEPYLPLLAIQVIDAMDEQGAPLAPVIEKLARSQINDNILGYAVRVAQYMIDVEKQITDN
jgi:uncharacterized sulfatase